MKTMPRRYPKRHQTALVTGTKKILDELRLDIFECLRRDVDAGVCSDEVFEDYCNGLLEVAMKTNQLVHRIRHLNPNGEK